MPDYKNISDASLPGSLPKKRGRPKLPRDKKGNVIRTPKPKEPVEEHTCCCCGKVYETQEKNFITTSSPLFFANNGYYPVCRECIAKYYLNIVLPAVDGDERRAVEVICGLCDWFFYDELLDLAAKITEGYRDAGTKTPLAITYGQRRNMTQFKKRGTTYLDTVKQRWEAGKIVQTHDDLHGDPNDPDSRKEPVDEADVWFFGPGYSAAEYKYLREQYDDWCERYDCQLKAEEEIFKTLSIAQLNVQKAQQAGEYKRTTEAIKTLQDLMNTAKIQPKQKDDSALVEQNTFGTLIRRWENEQPIPEPNPEWVDVDHIKRYIGAFFLGHLTKMFKLDNEWSQIYDEEMQKYTVSPPKYEEADDRKDDFDEQFKQYRNAHAKAKDGGDDA